MGSFGFVAGSGLRAPEGLLSLIESEGHDRPCNGADTYACTFPWENRGDALNRLAHQQADESAGVGADQSH
jgi:hypothetical protein